MANLSGFVRLNDLETRLFFTGYTVYGTTKLENILFTRELGRRLAGTGVLATCFNPGPVATDLARGTLIGAASSSTSGAGSSPSVVWSNATRRTPFAFR